MAKKKPATPSVAPGNPPTKSEQPVTKTTAKRSQARTIKGATGTKHPEAPQPAHAQPKAIEGQGIKANRKSVTTEAAVVLPVAPSPDPTSPTPTLRSQFKALRKQFRAAKLALAKLKKQYRKLKESAGKNKAKATLGAALLQAKQERKALKKSVKTAKTELKAV